MKYHNSLHTKIDSMFINATSLDKVVDFQFSVVTKSLKGQVEQVCNFFIQSWTFVYARLLNKPYVNEITLTGQNPSLKHCLALEILTQFFKGLDFLMLKIWNLQVKGLQSYRPSNFENVSTSPGFEPGPTGLNGAGAGRQTFS